MARVDYFKSIDTKEKAYILGYFCGDGHIVINENFIKFSAAICDKDLIYNISLLLDSKYSEDLSLNKQTRKFPNASTTVYSKELVRDVIMMTNGRLKKDRTLPIIKEGLTKYMVRGFFDADGCITWGYRKDRDRMWGKVSFTSQQKLLIALQNILLKQDISTKMYPKSNEDCYVIDFANESNIIKFFEYINVDIDFCLARKTEKFTSYINALFSKYKINVNDVVYPVDSRTLKKYNKQVDGVIFSSPQKIVSINNDWCILEDGTKVSIWAVRKDKTSNYALRLELDEFGKNYGLT